MPVPELQNTGVIEQPPLATDYIAGVESGCPTDVLVADGDWSAYLPNDETQHSVYFDSFACVTFSALNTLETLLNEAIASNRLPTPQRDFLIQRGYYINGKVNFSDRFTARQSGTTHQGNYLGAVADSIRHDGLVPEAAWPYPRDQRTPVFDWADYYADVPQSAIDLGKQFVNLFDVRYEWVPTPIISQYLKYAPVQVVTKVCPGWNSADPIPACGTGSGHATAVYRWSDGVAFDYDSYVPCRKRLGPGYGISSAMRYSVQPRAPQPPTPSIHVTYNFKADVKYGQRSLDVKMLQTCLQSIGMFPATIVPTGFYGGITATGVLRFQAQYQVASKQELAALGGRVVGPKTRAALNRLFA